MRTLAKLAPIAMLEVTLEGIVSWANDLWVEFVAVEPIHVSSQAWFESVHPDERPRVIEIWRSATAVHASFELECCLCVPGKKNRWIEVRAAPLLEPLGNASPYMLAVMDVTEKHRLRQMVRATEELETWAEQSAAALSQQSKELGIFAALVASSADAIAIIEPDGTARYFNRTFRLLFDVSNEISWSEFLVILGADENTVRALQKARSEDASWESTVTLERHNRGPLPADISSFSIFDATSRKIGFSLVIRDLSAHKEVEAERARLNAEIIAAQESAIRELSTPLLPIGPGIIAMPLIGNIDATRGQLILDRLLAGIHDHQADVAILDLTGVRRINTEITNILVRCSHGAQLLGARVVLTGVSPQVAKSFIQIGMDLTRLRTLGTLEQGIRAAFKYIRSHKDLNRRNNHPTSST